jgi:rhodanese-related sulfurtransferase
LIEAAWSKILRLEFHDADANGRSIDPRIDGISQNQLSLFTENQAVEILKFLKEHQDAHTQVIVHCEGGVSRSAAVSKFIAQIYNLEFPEGYSLYNRHVYSTLLRVHGASMYGEGLLDPQDLPGYLTTS